MNYHMKMAVESADHVVCVIKLPTLYKKNIAWGGVMAQLLKALATKADDLSSIPRDPPGGQREPTSAVVLWSSNRKLFLKKDLIKWGLQSFFLFFPEVPKYHALLGCRCLYLSESSVG